MSTTEQKTPEILSHVINNIIVRPLSNTGSLTT